MDKLHGINNPEGKHSWQKVELLTAGKKVALWFKHI